MVEIDKAMLYKMQEMSQSVATSEKSEENYGKKASDSPWDYPFFFNSADWARYQKYQIAYFNMDVMLILFFFGTCFYVFRCNILHAHEDGFYFACSLASTSCSFILYLMFFTCYLVKHWIVDYSSRLYKAADYILNSPWIGDIYKDLIAITGILGVTFGLVGRVMNGACSDHVSLWESQRCNPVAACFSLPQDHVMFIFILPIIAQSMLNGVTYRCSVISWLISTFTVIACLFYVQGWLDVWILLTPFSTLAILYRHEKLARVTFGHNMRTALSEKQKRKHILLQQGAERDLLSANLKHDFEIMSLRAQEECRLIEKEHQQMVAMIGNIAHDLKTPLQSFIMDLESLKSDESFCKCEHFPHIYNNRYFLHVTAYTKIYGIRIWRHIHVISFLILMNFYNLK